ncbi:unannotated protein [freshwater metagenome]|uniref:Unannotated protein n=1 Tax=freshwater metagenome TaxID=449393 RepID=A0A6J7NDN4_9ZZZZ
MVLVVQAVARLLLHEVQQVRNRCKHFATAEYVLTFGRNIELSKFGAVLQTKQLANLFNLGAQLAVELVATYARQVVTAVLEESRFEVSASRLDVWWFARTSALVNFDECLFAGWRDWALLFPLALKEVEVVNKTIEEAWGVLFVVTQCTKQGENAKTTLASNAGTGCNALTWFVLDVELEPFAAVWVNGALYQLVLGQVTEAVTLAWFENDAR